MAAQQPTILFIPGAWHFPAGFDAVRELLKPLGYPTEAVAHPSIGAEPPNTTLDDDIANTRAEIMKLVEAGKKIVVVAHSYGGIVGSSAVEDLGFNQRKAIGKEGGVINFVYMAALALPKGCSPRYVFRDTVAPWMVFKGDRVCAAEPAKYFYHDLTRSEQKKWIAELTHMSAPVFGSGTTHEPWHHMPCTYIFCEYDRVIPLDIQKKMAASIGSGLTTFYINASHSPFLSVPDEVVKGIELASKVGLAKSL